MGYITPHFNNIYQAMKRCRSTDCKTTDSKRIFLIIPVWLLYSAVVLMPGIVLSQDHTLDAEIVTANDTEKENLAVVQLKRILDSYDLEPWIFTRKIRIESGVIPHSHPVLTLNTRHLDSDLNQLATFIHEQIHWYLSNDQNHANFLNALKAVRQKYPEVPGPAGGGARDEGSTHLHLIVNWLEFDALKKIAGQNKALRVIENKDYYEWIYKRVTVDTDQIHKILSVNNLLIEDKQP